MWGCLHCCCVLRNYMICNGNLIWLVGNNVYVFRTAGSPISTKEVYSYFGGNARPRVPPKTVRFLPMNGRTVATPHTFAECTQMGRK